MLAEHTLTGFLDELYSDSPAPGGGSVAALNGALAASLTAMVANLTIGKKNYESANDEMTEIAQKMAKLKDVFIAFIDKDAHSFNGVIAAFKMPKDTDEQKSVRTAAIQEGYKEAIAVPLTVAKSASELFDIIEEVIKKGNKNAASDGLIAAISTRTAMLSALLNVEINLSAVKDQAYVSRIKEDVISLKQLADQREKDILNLVKF